MASRPANLVWFNSGPLPAYIGCAATQAAFDKQVVKDKARPVHWLCEGAVAVCHHWRDPSNGMLVLMLTFDMDQMRGLPVENLAGIVAHEVTHAWQDIMRYMSETEAGDEIPAYAIQYYVMVVMRYLREWLAAHPKRKR